PSALIATWSGLEAFRKSRRVSSDSLIAEARASALLVTSAATNFSTTAVTTFSEPSFSTCSATAMFIDFGVICDYKNITESIKCQVLFYFFEWWWTQHINICH